jgi:hypothetical protein
MRLLTKPFWWINDDFSFEKRVRAVDNTLPCNILIIILFIIEYLSAENVILATTTAKNSRILWPSSPCCVA